MTADAYPAFPDLSKIAFRKTDQTDHVGGGHCAGLPDGSTYVQWELVLAQNIGAFNYLVDKAIEDGDGWALTRPVLFAAHHVCELGLKTASVARFGQQPKRGHHLEPLWTRLAKGGGLKHLDATQINEARAFIDVMTELTPDGQTTRYPMPAPNDVGAVWCCLNSRALRDAVYAFLARLEPPI
jgi:hypothetical protein